MSEHAVKASPECYVPAAAHFAVTVRVRRWDQISARLANRKGFKAALLTRPGKSDDDMTKRILRLWVLLFVFSAVIAGDARAQGADKELRARETHRDWSVFVDGAGARKYCYAATVPVSTKAFRGGSEVDNITRGQAYLLVARFPSDRIDNEISVRLGYPADDNKQLTLSIGGASFKLYAEGEELWLSSPDDDSAVIAAMRRGSKAVVTATSKRGTRVVDDYSLLGFTASLSAVARACR